VGQDAWLHVKNDCQARELVRRDVGKPFVFLHADGIPGFRGDRSPVLATVG
jgi:hypothetical protein